MPSSLYIYGDTATGKTQVVQGVLSLSSARFAFRNCIECYTPRLLLEPILDQLLGKCFSWFCHTIVKKKCYWNEKIWTPYIIDQFFNCCMVTSFKVILFVWILMWHLPNYFYIQKKLRTLTGFISCIVLVVNETQYKCYWYFDI